jgi:hypothetical protein
MGKKISPSAKPSTTPTTGPRQKKKKKGAILDESDLPWEKIVTRWDLAREQLRISLSRLTPEKQFCVIWFGTEADTLDACKGMMKATRGNIDKVMAELDGLQLLMHPAGSLEAGRSPDGELRGNTNLHAGLMRAFGLTTRGIVGASAYVDDTALSEGCDTIFVLTDGAPTDDDFGDTDIDYGERQVVEDRESGKPGTGTGQMNYQGPYVDPAHIIDEVERMNMLRRIRMHCIGLGEADMTLLERLAKLCQGQAFSFGSKNEATK